MRRRFKWFAHLILLGGTASPSLAADTWLDAVALIGSPCTAQANNQFVFGAVQEIPLELAFLIGGGASLIHESVQIDQEHFGTNKSTSITARHGDIVVASGFSEGGIGLRVVAGDARTFCESRTPIVLTYRISDPANQAAPGLRVSLKFGEPETQLRWDTGARQRTLEEIDRKNLDRLKFFLGSDLRWHTRYLNWVKTRDARIEESDDFCGSCNDRSRFRFAMALTRFLAKADLSEMIAPNDRRILATWPNDLRFRGRSVLDPQGTLEMGGVDVDVFFSAGDWLTISPIYHTHSMSIAAIVMDGAEVDLRD